mmetsp:Transcript_62518/g.114873  ORF Transcript_62518/g.114873 Transcript_62518/m.114873 type:complete len:600 (-) Transcript_62518:300-2099(-)
MEHKHLVRIPTKDMSEHAQPHEATDRGEPCLQRTALKVLNFPGFDLTMGIIIVINMVVMVINVNESVSEEGDDEDEIKWTNVFGWGVLLIFVFELAVRLIALQCGFWSDPWNVADFVIVTVDVVFSLVGIFAGELFPASILRIFRLAKLARVSKVLMVFPELRLLLAGLLSSMRAIFWGTVLMGLFLLVWSMMAVVLIHPVAKNIDFEGCTRCPRAYSSVWQASLTLWQQIVTGDSWGEATIPVIEKHPITVLFFVPVFLSIGLAVMNLMLGVVVTVAQTAYESKLEEVNATKAFIKLQHQSNVLELCSEMDTDSDGVLSRDEIHAGFVHPGQFRDCMQALGITDDDFEIAWAVLDADQSGEVSYKEFVTCLCTMKSSDTHFMLTYIKYYITWMRSALMEQINKQHQESQSIERKLQQTLDLVEEQEDAILHDEELILNKLKADVGAEEQEDKDKPAASIKGDESVLPEPDSPRRKLEPNSPSKRLSPSYEDLLQSWNSTTGKALMSASADNEMQACLQKVGDEIEVLRNELKNSLNGLDLKLGQQISCIQGKHQVVLPHAPQTGSDPGPRKGAELILEVKDLPSKLHCQSGAHEVTHL